MLSYSKIKYIEKNKQFLYLNLSHISHGLKMELFEGVGVGLESF